MAKVTFDLAGSDWGIPYETLNATFETENRYKLENCPFYAYGYAYHDVVVVDFVDDRLMVKNIFQRSGHSNYRVMLNEGKDHEDFLGHFKELEALGCSFEHGTSSLYAVDVPPEIDIERVVSYLEKGEIDQIWQSEDGYVANKSNE